MKSPFRGWEWKWSDDATIGCLFCWVIVGTVVGMVLAGTIHWPWYTSALIGIACELPLVVLAVLMVALGVVEVIKAIPDQKIKAPIGRKDS